MYTRDIQCGKIPRESEGPGCCSWVECVETRWGSCFRVILLDGWTANTQVRKLESANLWAGFTAVLYGVAHICEIGGAGGYIERPCAKHYVELWRNSGG